jgi:hypothetical protein
VLLTLRKTTAANVVCSASEYKERGVLLLAWIALTIEFMFCSMGCVVCCDEEPRGMSPMHQRRLILEGTL